MGAFLVVLALGLLGYLFHRHGNTHEPKVYTESAFRWMAGMWWYRGSYGGARFWTGWAVPLLALWMAWRQRHAFRALPARPVNGALLLIALGVLVHWVGYKSQQTRLSLAALLLILWALPLYFRGWRAAWLMLFPCSLLFFCIPLNFLDSAMIPARLLAAGMAAGLVRGFGFTADNVGAELVLTDAPGMRFLCMDPYNTLHAQLTILILAAVLGHLSQRSLPRQWLVFLAGGPAASLGNIVRLTAAGVAGHMGGPEAIARTLAWSPVIVYVTALTALGVWAFWLRRRPRAPVETVKEPS